LLAFIKRFVVITLDSREVYEYIFAAVVRGDEPKPLSALNHFTKPVILLDIDTSLINEPLSVAMMACI